MMNTHYFFGLLAFTLFIIIWFGIYKYYFTLAFRRYLFELRDKLFDYACENGLPFDSPAFIDRWEEINGLIRYAHNIHMLFLTIVFSAKEVEAKAMIYSKRKTANLLLAEEKHRDFLNQNAEEQKQLFISYLVKSSLILLFASIFVVSVSSVVMYIFTFSEKRTKIKSMFKNKRERYYSDYTYLTIGEESKLAILES